MRVAPVLLLVLLSLVAVAPVASAGPVPPTCVQVYPWSELCNGNPGAVVCYYVGSLVNLEDCDLRPA